MLRVMSRSLVLWSSFALLAAGCGSPAESAPTETAASPTAASSPGAETGQASGDEMTSREPLSLDAPADVAAPPADAQRTRSGLASKVLSPGRGTTHPTASDTVTVHYVGWTTDGARFDSSVERGQPSSFPLDGVIVGWTEGVQLMVVGERRRFWIPEELAYKGRPGRPQGMLVFDVELISIDDE